MPLKDKSFYHDPPPPQEEQPPPQEEQPPPHDEQPLLDPPPECVATGYETLSKIEWNDTSLS